MPITTKPIQETTFCSSSEAAETLGVTVEEVKAMVNSGAIESWPGADGRSHILRASVKAKSDAPVPLNLLGSETNQLRPLLVYVVDDDPNVLESYRTQFSKLSNSVLLITFNSVFDALLSITRHTPKLLILDLWLLEVNWFLLVQSLRNSPALNGLKIVVGTEMGENLMDNLVTLPPGVAVFRKPVPIASLEALIAELLLV